MHTLGNSAGLDTGTQKKLAVLINDDLLAETILIHMQKKGFHVRIYYNFESLEEGLQKNSTHPDILVFDMDYFDFTVFQNFYSHAHDRDFKILAISSNNDMNARLKAVRAHVCSFVSKPLSMDKLAIQINTSLALKKRKIYSVLIIGNSLMDLKLYQHILESNGIRTRFIENPLDTLQELEHHKSDLILLDDDMPTASGLDIIKVIRQVYSRSELPVIFMTRSKDPKVLSNMRNESYLDPIDKSLNHDYFLERVFGALE